MLHHDYHSTYDANFFHRSDGKSHWDQGRLKVGDDLAAIAYALGIPSFETLLEILCLPPDSDGRDPDCSLLKAKEQLLCLVPHQTRHPRSVLDVGGGRGEVSTALAWLDIPVQLVEPHKNAFDWVSETACKLFPPDGDPSCDTKACRPFRLINTTVPECLPSIDLAGLDTVMFCESLEHIPEECFTPFWEKVGEVLRRNNGMLIVTNWLDYHPLHVSGREHCRLVDDALYEELAQGGTVVYRRGSHLVIQY